MAGVGPDFKLQSCWTIASNFRSRRLGSAKVLLDRRTYDVPSEHHVWFKLFANHSLPLLTLILAFINLTLVTIGC